MEKLLAPHEQTLIRIKMNQNERTNKRKSFYSTFNNVMNLITCFDNKPKKMVTYRLLASFIRSGEKHSNAKE